METYPASDSNSLAAVFCPPLRAVKLAGQHPSIPRGLLCLSFGPDRGAVEGEAGLYVCGLHFQHSTSSTMIHGAARDAGYIADKIGEWMRAVAR